jgi:hypothetical protein
LVHFVVAFQIFFSHTKTDQTVEDSKHPRQLYASPHNPFLCPVTALGIYLTNCFSKELISDQIYLFSGKWFIVVSFALVCVNVWFAVLNQLTTLILFLYLKTGSNQDNRFSKFLSPLLKANKHDIRAHNFENMESLNPQGASSYLTSLPDGPHAAAIIIHGGWSVGTGQCKGLLLQVH